MLPMVTLDPRLCPVDDHLSATSNTALAVGPARFSRLAAKRSWRMAQLSVGSAGPAGFAGMAGATPPLPSGAPDCPDLPRCAALRAHLYAREHGGGMVRWMDRRGQRRNT